MGELGEFVLVIIDDSPSIQIFGGAIGGARSFELGSLSIRSLARPEPL